ncbi:MAG: hypothetical protein KDK99_05455 [Verrucomicrobiales bacterium]|nr:hypothetical protein [Verrucomicrobiales bacterium]
MQSRLLLALIGLMLLNGQLETILTADETQTQPLLGSGKVQLTAIMNEGGAPIDTDISWEILSKPDAEGHRRSVAQSYDPQPNLIVPAGKFLVKVKVGDTQTTADIEVTPGQTTIKTLSLGAGRLTLTALAATGGNPLTRDLSWEILSSSREDDQRDQIASSDDAQPTFTLPANPYLISVKWGETVVNQTVELTAGKQLQTQIILNAGSLIPTATMTDGAAPATTDLSWEVLGQPNAEGDRPSLGASNDAQPQFHLAAGRYLVKLVRGPLRAQQEIEVIAGQTAALTLNLNGGTLQLHATQDGSWEIFGPLINGERQVLTYSYDKDFKTFVPVGNLLVVRHRNDDKIEQQVEIKANALSELTLDVK